MSLFDEFMKSLNTEEAAVEGVETEVETPEVESEVEEVAEAPVEEVEEATEVPAEEAPVEDTADTATEGVAEADTETEEPATEEAPVEEAPDEEVAEEPAVEEPVEKPAEEAVEEITEGTMPVDEALEEDADAPVEFDDEEILTEGLESLLFLDTLRATSTKEEFKQFLADNATELELYGLVSPAAIARESYMDDEDLDTAMEAKNIVRLNREAKISREEARISIGLAKKGNDPLYKYYHKYSGLKRQFRDKIYAKYGSRATPLARKAVLNSRNKASLMNSPAGSGIVGKIDSRLKQLDKNGRNNEAIKKDTKAGKAVMAK